MDHKTVTFLEWLRTDSEMGLNSYEEVVKAFDNAIHNLGHIGDDHRLLYSVVSDPDTKQYGVVWVERTPEEWTQIGSQLGFELAKMQLMETLEQALNDFFKK